MPNRSRHQTQHEALISGKYEKALSIVQQLTASSGIQPSREQKLQLYACYKQVNGDVNTPRPGIFDVIGRAKWDAWRNLSGTKPIAAKERYVNILLQVASEAFRKSGENEHARRILQILGSMKVEDTTQHDSSTSNSEDLSETDSENAEERAYLAEVEKNEMAIASDRPRPGPSFERSISETGKDSSRRPPQPKYARSLLDSTSMDKLRTQAPPPTNVAHRSRRSSLSSVSTTDNLRTRYYARSVTSNQSSRRAQSTLAAGSQRDRATPNLPLRNYRYSAHEDDLNGATKHWAQVPGSSSQPTLDDFDSDDSIEDERRATDASMSEFDQGEVLMRGRLRTTNMAISPPRIPSVMASQTIRGPPSVSGRASLIDSAASRQGREQFPSDMRDRAAPLSPSVSVVDLGPATKRALQSLQSEVIALNGRLDGLKSELLENDTKGIVPKSRGSRLIASVPSKNPSSSTDKDSDDEHNWEGWKWVVKAAARHAVVNLITTFIILLILYKRKSPISATLSIQMQKYWALLRRIVQ